MPSYLGGGGDAYGLGGGGGDGYGLGGGAPSGGYSGAPPHPMPAAPHPPPSGGFGGPPPGGGGAAPPSGGFGGAPGWSGGQPQGQVQSPLGGGGYDVQGFGPSTYFQQRGPQPPWMNPQMNPQMQWDPQQGNMGGYGDPQAMRGYYGGGWQPQMYGQSQQQYGGGQYGGGQPQMYGTGQPQPPMYGGGQPPPGGGGSPMPAYEPPAFDRGGRGAGAMPVASPFANAPAQDQGLVNQRMALQQRGPGY